MYLPSLAMESFKEHFERRADGEGAIRTAAGTAALLCRGAALWRCFATLLLRRSGVCLVFGFLQEGPEGVHRDSDSASGESVHVGGVDTDDLAVGVEDRAAAAAVSGGSIVNELSRTIFTRVNLTASGGRTNQ